MLKVIDVSEHQGAIDWAKVKPNIDAAIIRLGYGSDEASQDDKKWNYNVGECERLGIPFGAYIYSYADTENKARSEATHTIRQLKGHKFSLPVYFDAEEARCGSFAESAFKIWDKLVADAGYKTGLYSGYYYRRSYMGGAQPKSWWMAWYAAEAYVKTHMLANWKYDGWQYTSTGSCPGIYSNGLDVSVFYTDFRDSEIKPVVQKTEKPNKLVVDGILGVRTIKAWQKYLGVADDGIIGANTSKAIQKWAGSTPDGIIGINTRKAVQKKLGVAVDGIWGRITISALQNFLNNH